MNHPVVEGHRQAGGQFAGGQVVPDVLAVEGVAHVAHGGLLVGDGAQLAVEVDGEVAGGLVGGQPGGHHRHRRLLGLDHLHRQLVEAVAQGVEDSARAGLAASITSQPPTGSIQVNTLRRRVKARAAARSTASFDLLHLLAAGLEALLGLDGLRPCRRRPG